MSATQMYAFYSNFSTSTDKKYRDNSQCPSAFAQRKASNIRHDKRLQAELDGNDLSKYDPLSE